MTDATIKEIIAPCGLCCETCFAHVNGNIRKYSLKLKEKLGSFHNNARRFEILLGDPIFKKYAAFKEMLDYFSSENCKGCRKEQCKIFNHCGVRPCHQEKGIDFCYQCDEFPCHPNISEVWLEGAEACRRFHPEKGCRPGPIQTSRSCLYRSHR